jgi:HK97 family phage prohead protease
MKNKPSQPKHELRISALPQRFEVRKNEDGSRNIKGYAAVFDSLSEDLGGFRERISKGAFGQSLKDHSDVLLLYGHDTNNLLARVASGSLTLSEDSHGLRFSASIPPTSLGNDVTTLMDLGTLASMSFGFVTIDDDWEQVGDEVIRTLNQVLLFEISIVGQPAYTQASVSLRSLPASLRGKVKAKRSDEDNPDLDQDVTECDCTCDECEDDGNCEECSNSLCESDSCIGCATQEREMHMALIMRRLRA